MSRPPYVSLHIPPAGGRRSVRAGDIVACVEREVRSGRVPRGSRLPPVRILEQTLGLSKNTAQAAYDELCARGLTETREREGVFVTGPGEAAAPGPEAPSLAARPLRMREAPPLPPARLPGTKISLSTVFIDPDLLPRERLAECARSVLRSPKLATLYDAQGYGPLRELIAARLRSRGMAATADMIITTTGSQQALDMVARATARRSVGVETPVYPHARFLFETHGLTIVPLPLDPFAGLDLDAWEKALREKRPGFVYSITSFQNPTGYSYSSHELERLLSLARELDVGVVEDDWGSDMLSGSEYRPTLRAMGGSHVLYVGSFTKKLLPSLRVGFLLADPASVGALLAMKRVATLGNVWLSEAIVAEFLDRGYYDTHLAAAQAELDLRYGACLSALEQLMPEGVRWTTPGGGPTLWLELPRTVPLDRLRQRLAERGVDVEDSSSAFVGAPHLHGFRISYAFSPAETVRQGLALTAEEIRRALGQGG